jgi:hypothetical protein
MSKQSRCTEQKFTRLRDIQERIRFDAPSMAACLGITPRAYRNYLYDARQIPPHIARAALELEQINVTFMETLPSRVDQHIPPDGYISEVTQWQ